jgi:cysteine desulfurase/selenocysteine lyase
MPVIDPSSFDFGTVLWAMHCAEGPVPRASVEVARRFLEKELRPWLLGMEEWQAIPRRVRQRTAELFAASPDDVTIAGSTSDALTAVAQSYPWRRGDEVLAPLGEFPSNVWPWKALEGRGVRFREVALWDGQRAGEGAWQSAPPRSGVDPEGRLLEAIGPETRVLTVSWVRFQDGLLLDLRRLAAGCAERGVDLVVDGIQGAGALPIDLAGLSAFATGVHKGLLAPQGVGLLWTSPALRARLQPLGSWLSVEGAGDFSRANTDLRRAWVEDGRKLERGGYDGLSLTALEASLALLAGVGPAAIADQGRALAGELLARLDSGPWAAEAARLRDLLADGRLGPIIALHHEGRGPDGLLRLIREGMRREIFTSVREGYLRVALHGWHSPADVERLADWLNGATG